MTTAADDILKKCINIFSYILEKIRQIIRQEVSNLNIFVPRLFEEKRRDTVFGFPWCVVPNF